MKAKKMIWIALAIILAGISACGPLEPTMDANALGTIVAQNVELTQMAGTLTAVVAQQSATPEASNTPTVTKTLRPTPTETVTPTPLSGYVLTFDQDTNCRLGPNTSFARVALVKAGTQLQALGRSEDGEFFYVRTFDTTNHYCWVWKGTSYKEGSISQVPVFTAVPTKEPSITPTSQAGFNASYDSLQSCSGAYALRFNLVNTGFQTWQSIKIVIVDNSTGTTVTHTANEFIGYLGCNVAQTQGDLTTNEAGLVSSYNPGQFSYDPSGHQLTVTISLYSEKNQAGTIISRALPVTP